jgi:uracil-DNA glycosylase family 4
MAWHPRPASCAQCPAHSAARSYTPSRGSESAPLLLLDSAPDEVAASLGSPLTGDNGRTLGTWLRLAGINPDRECRISGVSWCWQPEKKEPGREEIEHCRSAHWGVELQGRRVIVPIGVPAMRQFYAKAGESTAGQIIRQGDTYIVGLLHPSFILRGNWGQEPLQIQTLKLVRRILDGWEPEIYDFTKPPRGANLAPTLEELRAWSAELRPGDEISLDVEAAGNVHVLHGLTRVRDLSHVALWWRQPGGDPWPHADWPGVVEWAYDLYASRDIGKAFHNGSYDIVDQLEEVGFEVNNYSFDTLLAAHIAFPEMRKRLEAVSKLCGGPTGWKPYLKEGEGDQK